VAAAASEAAGLQTNKSQPNQIKSIQMKSNQIKENFIQIKSNHGPGLIWIFGFIWMQWLSNQRSYWGQCQPHFSLGSYPIW
jgi:hypothetical protein